MIALLTEGTFGDAKLSHPLPVWTEAGEYRETYHIKMTIQNGAWSLVALDFSERYGRRRDVCPAYRRVPRGMVFDAVYGSYNGFDRRGLFKKVLRYHGYEPFVSMDRRAEGDGLGQENAYEYRLETLAILSPVTPQTPRGEVRGQ